VRLGRRGRPVRRWLREQLLTVSGANRGVLREAPKERTKQVAMGGVLVATAALAAVASAYALYIALHVPVPVAVVGGLVWGVIILNLDRWLVVSAPRLKTRWGTLGMALPRVILAVLIGAVVSTPLTLAVFSAEIDAEIEVMAAEAEEDFEDQLNADSRYQGMDAMEERITALEKELQEVPSEADVIADPAVVDMQARLDDITKQHDAAAKAVICEADGTCGTGDPGDGPETRQKTEERDRLRDERDALTQQLADLKVQVRERLAAEDERRDADARAELTTLRKDVSDLEEQRADEVAAHEAAVGTGDGILARLSALERIQHKDPILGTAHLLLFLFLTALECLPIIFKTMLGLAPPSLYERLVALDDEKVEERVRLRLQTEYEEAETMARSAVAAAEARAARTLEAESRATGMVLDAQLALTEDAVLRWQEEQLNVAMSPADDNPFGDPRADGLGVRGGVHW
jgi:hypothetical protein